MIYIPFSAFPYLLSLGLAVLIAKLLFQALRWYLARSVRQIGAAFSDWPAGPVEGGLANLNPLRIGQKAEVRTSLNTILLRTTLGVRLWAVAMNVLVNAVLWIIAPGELIAAGWPSAVISLSGSIACLGLFLYEARVEYDRLIIRKWGLFQREYPWADLRDIRDNKHYEYILRFRKTDVRMPKHLVGVSGFLTFVNVTIAGNILDHARTARS
ncbi:hypothetical protein EGN72_13675 [Pseudorhodobacter sp. E13]|uniref:hypothetical protein n=1 Tax=Pseudorhodobacter sp. E13 TaxID=2487931 RepID=UPI000F8D0A4D|nr:hypothetical protein [Pseudorhodobacter sp. E13]RUS59739.1 hypothetical protein EGN72_13675 [Pseudorhodobacter sp. E13]